MGQFKHILVELRAWTRDFSIITLTRGIERDSRAINIHLPRNEKEETSLC